MNHAFGVVSKKCSFPSQSLAPGLYALAAHSVLVLGRAREGGKEEKRKREAPRLRNFEPRYGESRDSGEHAWRAALEEESWWGLETSWKDAGQRARALGGRSEAEADALVSCH